MTQKSILITGANGGIGEVLCNGFKEAGWYVVATDKTISKVNNVDEFVMVDLNQLCIDEKYRVEKLNKLNDLFPSGLTTLINNAAIQIVAPIEKLSLEDWQTTQNINVTAPFLLAKTFLPQLEKARGSIINIASIHAKLTKPNFAAYATSKASLIGLTHSLAVELGSRVRVNAISPAAISTDMLVSGFSDNPKGLAELAEFHPSKNIGSSQDILDMSLYLAEGGKFLNGTVIGLDGGIASRLHDPI